MALRRRRDATLGDPDVARAACRKFWAGEIQAEEFAATVRGANLAPIQMAWLRNWVPRSFGQTGQRCDTAREILRQIEAESG